MENNFWKKLSVILVAFASIFLYFILKPEPPPPKAETVRITIPEGFNVRQIGERLEVAGLFAAADFIKVAQKEEGFLFPDTYEFYKKTSSEAVIQKMKENFLKKVGPEVSREVIIMASLLEEEAAREEDRRIISGILWKRLEAGAALRVDATLTYLTGRASSALTDEDLKIDSPYNTYLYPGLPAGPISNPGLGAIDAALNPKPSPYWYYLSDKAGNIHFARTFEEHKLNKEKYLR